MVRNDSKTERAAEIEHAVRAADAERSRSDAAAEILDKVANALVELKSTNEEIMKRLDALEAKKAPAETIDETLEEQNRRNGEDRVPGDPVQTATDSKASSNEERAKRADAQARCDAVARWWDEQAPPPLAGEATLDYRRRLLKPYQRHSETFKDVDLGGLDPRAFNAAETVIYNDAIQASQKRPEIATGLYARQRKTDVNHTIIEYFGDPSEWMNRFAGTRQRATGNWKTGAAGLG